jgi:hypothetical protein
VAWILIAMGVALLWAGWDALVQLGAARPLTEGELDRAVLGEGGKRLSDAGRFLLRRMAPAHNAMERLLAAVFILAGAAFVAGGVLLLWSA